MPPVPRESPAIDCAWDVAEVSSEHGNIQILTTLCVVKVNLRRAKLRLSVCRVSTGRLVQMLNSQKENSLHYRCLFCMSLLFFIRVLTEVL